MIRILFYCLWIFCIQSALSGWGLADQKALYTWKDAQGRLHITDRPPPPDAALVEVTPYLPPKSGEPILQAESLSAKEVEQGYLESEQRKGDLDARRVEAARERAAEMWRVSEEYRKKAEALYQRGGSPPRRKRSREEAARLNDLAGRAADLARQAERLSFETEAAATQSESSGGEPDDGSETPALDFEAE